MRIWPGAWLVWAGGALIIAVNAIVLGGVSWNRSGEPLAQAQLSERELGIPYYWQAGMSKENSGLALQLEWRVGKRSAEPFDPAQHPMIHDRSADWLDEKKLLSLGFRTPALLDADHDFRLVVDRQLARSVWLLLEFDGESYQRVLGNAERRLEHVRQSMPGSASPESTRSTLESAESALRRERDHETRLFVIDADLDPAVLRGRYPDSARHLILRGRITAPRFRTSDPRKLPAGFVEAVDIDSIHVPARFRHVFDTLKGDRAHDGPPRFQVNLAWGRRFEPWIVDVQAIP